MWEALAEMHPLTRATRLLTDSEVERLCTLATSIPTLFRTAYPSLSVKLKYHIMEAHLPDFARRWRSIGLFSEDPIEHIHALINRLNRRFACVHGNLKAECKREALDVLQSPELMQIIADFKDRRSRGPYEKVKRD